ncbi:hypothetical protein X797_008400 [Metarhizium robertsii]|uniref:Rhodopsin domain-containing protein n=1 Tax=Metarhizium robertsii TaxID=568076 RepID=A0A0A1UR53_9HYPO|nr:hypothetical protein X797_008400 [Metarhizium robertsii]
MEFGSIVHLAASAVNITQLPACAVSRVPGNISIQPDLSNLHDVFSAGRRDQGTVLWLTSNHGTVVMHCRKMRRRQRNLHMPARRIYLRHGDMHVSIMWIVRCALDKGLEFRVVNFLLGSMALGLVIMRLFFKKYLSTSKRLGLDDWTILAGLILGVPSVVIQVFFLTPTGLGRDIWTLDIPTLLAFGHYFYVMEILYLTLMMLIKVALSLFYLSIFPGTVIRRLLWVTVAFHVACGLAFILKTVLQCTPVAYNWEKFNGDASTTGHCVDINASGWVNGVIGVVADIWLFALPLTQLKRLTLHWKKKVAAAIMFLTGAIITIVSMLRLKSLVHFANSYNPTWDQWSVVFWSTIEVSVGFICTCLPALRLILMRMYPQTFKSDSYASSSFTSRNLYRRSSISRIVDEGCENDLVDLSQSNLIPAHLQDTLKDNEDGSGARSGKIRIQSLQALPLDENSMKGTARDQTAARKQSAND